MEFGEIRGESITFGRFELKLRSGELCREGATVKLAPQPYNVLLLLVQHAGQLVTRKQLHEKIWGTDTHVDFDKGLNLCIAQIREALGDDAQTPRYIQTLPRRGYRFIANIDSDVSLAETLPSLVQGTALVSEAKPAPKLIEKARRPSFRISRSAASILALAVVLTAGIAITYFRSYQGSSTPAAKRAKSMLLVLPFENLTNDPMQNYFSDGLTEELITRIGSLQPERLGVIARTTTLTYKKSSKDIRQIGSELGVDYVLEGSVRREPGRLRITSQLIQVADQTHLWAEAFDRSEGDVLDIQSEVAMRVASSLSLELLPGSYSEVAARKLAKPAAYDAYLKGRYLITKDTPEDLTRSIPYFDLAIAEDPDFAPAYAAEVEALILLTSGPGGSASLPKAKAAALKAVELSSSYAEGHAALGSVQLWLEWNLRDAEVNLKRAVQLNPYNPLTRINYGRCLLIRGKTEGGINEIKEALKLDPVSLLTTGLAAFTYLNVGRYDEAIALSNRMLELEPESGAARICLFQAYVSKGDYSQALKMTREPMVLDKAKPEELGFLDEGDSKHLLLAGFRKSLRDMKASASRGEKVWTMYGAWLSTRLGERDLAFEWLDKALGERSPLLLYLNIDPRWDGLRSDPRFGHLTNQLHL